MGRHLSISLEDGILTIQNIYSSPISYSIVFADSNGNTKEIVGLVNSGETNTHSGLNNVYRFRFTSKLWNTELRQLNNNLQNNISSPFNLTFNIRYRLRDGTITSESHFVCNGQELEIEAVPGVVHSIFIRDFVAEGAD